MDYTNEHFSALWEEVSEQCKDLYGIQPGNNARFVAETLVRECAGHDFVSYAECGVYVGTTFLPIYHVCKKVFPDFCSYAIDSFSGFPQHITHHENDRFERFLDLYRQSRITKDHLLRVEKRFRDLKKEEHLKTDYFSDYAEIFKERCENKPEIKIVKLSFDRLKSEFTKAPDRLDLVFLDCDLYLSYNECLEYFRNRTDLFIFDEYYSWKYPGARIACDEFVDQNHGWEFFNKVEAKPYFERWGIKRTEK